MLEASRLLESSLKNCGNSFVLMFGILKKNILKFYKRIHTIKMS